MKAYDIAIIPGDGVGLQGGKVCGQLQQECAGGHFFALIGGADIVEQGQAEAALREEAAKLRGEEGIEDFDREFKRRNLEASHALGMAHIFESRGEFGRAVDMIDLAKLRTPFNYLAYAAAGPLSPGRVTHRRRRVGAGGYCR